MSEAAVAAVLAAVKQPDPRGKLAETRFPAIVKLTTTTHRE